VKCPCGADVVVERASGAPAASGPYRDAADRPPPAPASKPRLGALCPRCGKALAAASDARWSCASCGGSFLDHATFADLVTVARAKVDPSVPWSQPARHARPGASETSIRYVRCPDCHEPMSRMNFGRRSGVILDACKAHGTWVDVGELDRALDFVRAGGLETEELLASPSERGEAAAMARTAQSLMKEEALIAGPRSRAAPPCRRASGGSMSR
jgi:Zn-finger nucleic acid-binding protein